MVPFIVIAVVSGSLVLSAVWGIYGNLPDRSRDSSSPWPEMRS